MHPKRNLAENALVPSRLARKHTVKKSSRLVACKSPRDHKKHSTSTVLYYYILILILILIFLDVDEPAARPRDL
jgi:hypothetical protein